MIHDEDFHARKHLISKLVTAGSDDVPGGPLPLDQDKAVIHSMSSTVTWQEVKSATSKDTIIAVLMNLGSCFPATKAELPVELQPCWQRSGGLYLSI